jgi:hypothetical protein
MRAIAASSSGGVTGIVLSPIVTVCGMRENSHPAVLQPPVRPGSEASAPCSLPHAPVISTTPRSSAAKERGLCGRLGGRG